MSNPSTALASTGLACSAGKLVALLDSSQVEGTNLGDGNLKLCPVLSLARLTSAIQAIQSIHAESPADWSALQYLEERVQESRAAEYEAETENGVTAQVGRMMGPFRAIMGVMTPAERPEEFELHEVPAGDATSRTQADVELALEAAYEARVKSVDTGPRDGS